MKPVIVLLLVSAQVAAQQEAVRVTDSTVIVQLQADVAVQKSEILHLRQLMDERDRRYAQEALAQKDAVGVADENAQIANQKSDDNAEKRLDGVNEFREQLRTQAGTFVTRTELFGWMIGMVGLISTVITILGKLWGRPRRGEHAD